LFVIAPKFRVLQIIIITIVHVVIKIIYQKYNIHVFVVIKVPNISARVGFLYNYYFLRMQRTIVVTLSILCDFIMVISGSLVLRMDNGHDIAT